VSSVDQEKLDALNRELHSLLDASPIDFVRLEVDAIVTVRGCAQSHAKSAARY
jgi:hypothetical protein